MLLHGRVKVKLEFVRNIRSSKLILIVGFLRRYVYENDFIGTPLFQAVQRWTQ
jgi:hypothetical protein